MQTINKLCFLFCILKHLCGTVDILVLHHDGGYLDLKPRGTTPAVYKSFKMPAVQSLPGRLPGV